MSVVPALVHESGLPLGHALLIAPYDDWPQDECESETPSGGDSFSTVQT